MKYEGRIGKKRRILVVLVGYLFIIASIYFLSDSTSIKNNIRVIDKADSVTIHRNNVEKNYDLEESIIDLISYGGTIVKVDNWIEELFMPYSNQLTQLNISITYYQKDIEIGSATVYVLNEESTKFILSMNNVYWSTGSNIEELLMLVETW